MKNSLDWESLNRLYSDWGNSSFAAEPEYGAQVALHAKTARRILECGAGWTTVVIARSGKPYLSLEHDHESAEQARVAVTRDGNTPSVAECRLIEQYGCLWYENPPLEEPYDLVVCDGPPALLLNRPDNRYALLPVCGAMLANGCRILLHDAQREGEQRVIERWLKECPGSIYCRTGSCIGLVRLGPSS